MSFSVKTPKLAGVFAACYSTAMKSWFGAFGRACLEFFLLLAVAALISGAAKSLSASATTGEALLSFSLAALPRLIPLAVAVTMFCAMFSFEHRVPSRAAGWLGLVLLGALLLSGGLASRRLPFLRALLPEESKTTASPVLQSPKLGKDRGGLLLWYRSASEEAVADAAVVDFRAPYPRLTYTASAPLDRASGVIEVKGARFEASDTAAVGSSLFPETALLPGPPIWERFDGLAKVPLLLAAAALSGFVLLASGFRFIARLTRWPLANAFFAAAGLLAFLALDAALASPAIAALGSSFAGYAGLSSYSALIPAAAEGLLGLALGAVDLSLKPREESSRG